MATAAERARALEAPLERPTGAPSPEELAALELRRVAPGLAALLERPDPGPIPGPAGYVTT